MCLFNLKSLFAYGSLGYNYNLLTDLLYHANTFVVNTGMTGVHHSKLPSLAIGSQENV